MTDDKWSKEWPKTIKLENGSIINFADGEEIVKGKEVNILTEAGITLETARKVFDTVVKNVPAVYFKAQNEAKIAEAEVLNEWFKKQPDMMAPVITGLDLGIGDKTILTIFEDGAIKQTDVTDKYNNKEPTHDPYTNPNAHLYYECACGAILDPCTKSFAALNNAASKAGWKIRWKKNGEGYEPFCLDCGKEVE